MHAPISRCSSTWAWDPMWIWRATVLSSGLPPGRCQMEPAQVSSATPNWFTLAGTGSGAASLGLRVEREQRLCQRGTLKDALSWWRWLNGARDCTSLKPERQKHQSLFACGRVNLADHFEQDPIELAPFVRGLQWLIRSVHWIKPCQYSDGGVHLSRERFVYA